MDLYFLRHADAEPDGERPLSEEGRRDMKRVCRWLAQHAPKMDAVFTSPLLRARQTAEMAGEAVRQEPVVAVELDSGATLSSVRELLGSCGPDDNVLLVGHEPDFSTIIGQLIGGGRVEMKKAGLARVSCQVIEPGGGVLKWLLTPGLIGDGK